MGQMSIVIGVTTVGTQRAMREIQLMEATVKKAQVSMMQLGRSMTQFASLPAGIFAGAALANFAKFEFSIAKIVGLVGIADEQAKAWGKDVLNMSGDLGKGANELADALYYITSSGFKGAESMNILKISAQAAASGLGETKQVADIVTSAMNAYGASTLSAAEATNVLVMAVREGKGEPEDLTRAFATVIPISAKLGVQFHEVGGALAALTRLGMPAATAATYLRQTLFTLTKPSKQTRDALKAMGTSAGELRDSLENQGLLHTLRTLGDLTERFGEESMARVFPNIRAFMGVISLLQMDVAEVNEVFENTQNSSSALSDAFAAASETLKFKLNSAVAEGQSMLIKFGEALSRSVLPIVESIGRAFKDFGDWFGGLSKDSQDFIAKILGITIAGGPLLLLLSLLKAAGKELLYVFRYIFTGGWIKGINNTTNALNNQNNAVNAQTVAVQRQTAVINANTSAKVKNNLAQQALLTGNKSKIAGVIPMPVQNKATMAVKASMVANQSLNKVKNQIPIQATKLATEQQKLTILQNKYNSSVELQTRLLQASIHATNSAVTAQQRYESSLGIADAAAKKNNLTVSMSRMVAEQRNIALLEQAAAQKMAAAAELQAIEVGQLKNQVDKQANAVTAASIQNKALNKKATLLQIEATKLEAAAVKARNAAYQESILKHQQLLVANNTTNKAIRKHHKSLLAQRHAAEKSSVVMSGFTKVIKGVGSTLTKVTNFIAANWMIALMLAIGAISKYIKHLKEVNYLDTIQKKLKKEVAQAVGEETSKVQTYLAIAQNEIQTKEDRNAAIERLKEIAPAYFNMLDTESIKTNKAKEAIDAYNASITKSLELKAVDQALEEEYARRKKEMLEGTFNDVSIGDKIKMYFRHIGTALLHGAGSANFGIKIAEDPKAKQWVEEAARKSEERHNKTVEYLLNERAIISSNTQDLVKNYDYLAKKSDELINRNAVVQNKVKNATKEGKKEALKEQMEYQKSVKATLDLGKQTLTQLKEREEYANNLIATDNELQRLKEKGDIVGYAARLGDLQGTKNKIITEIQGKTAILEETIKNLDEVYQKGPKISEGDDVADDFLGGTTEQLTKLQQLQKDLTDAFDGYQTELLIVEKTAELYGKTTGIAADKAKVLETVINLAGEAMANSIPIDKAKLEAVINLYNSLVKLDEEEKVRAKVLEDVKKIQEDIATDSKKAWDEAEKEMLNYKDSTTLAMETMAKLSGYLIDVKNEFKKTGDTVEYVDSTTLLYNETLKELKKQLRAAIKNGEDIDYILKQITDTMTNLDNLSLEGAVAELLVLKSAIEAGKLSFGQINSTIEKLIELIEQLSKAPKTEWTEQAIAQLQEVAEVAIKTKFEMEMRDLKQDAIVDFFTAIGEGLGSMMAGVEDPWKGIIQSLFNVVKQIGSLLIAAGTLMIMAQIPLGYLWAAAGTGLVALATMGSIAVQQKNQEKEPTKMAAGGVVPPGFPNDTFPAMLTSGEIVVPKNKTQDAMAGLFDFLSLTDPTFRFLRPVFDELIARKQAKEILASAPKMSYGGIVPSGYQNDSYPAMLSSGEVIIPPKRLPKFERDTMDVNVVIEGVVRGKDIYYVTKEVERKYKNSF